MFDGIGELLLILIVVLMLFGSKEIPDIARFLGKTMAQLKNATNEIKSEIQKGAESNGLDTKALTDITRGITSEVDQVKGNILGDTMTQIEQTTEQISDLTGPIKRQM